MPNLTPRIGLKKPTGNENVMLASFNENYDILDAKVASVVDLNVHKLEAMPHQFTDTSNDRKYRYGFKTNAAKDGLVFVYEEVL